MRITKVRLRDFRRHERLDIEPAAGLTIIRGPNESGKTTLQQALEMALFRKAESGSQPTLAARRWGTEHPPSVELEFEVDGVPGRLSKTWAGLRGGSELSIGDEIIRDPNAIQERMAQITGIPTEAFFRSTASVGHAELTKMGGEEPAIADRLQEAVSGADRGTAAAKKKLDEAIRRYRSEGPKNPGRLKAARDEITRLDGESQAGRQALERLEIDRAAWVAAHERRLQLDAELAGQQATLAEAERAVALAERRDAAQAGYERLRRAVELVEARERLARQLPTLIPLPDLRAGVARLNGLGFDLSELEAELAVDADLAADLPAHPPRPWPWVIAAALLLLAAIAATLVLQGVVAMAAVAILGVAVVVAMVMAARAARRARQVALAREMSTRAASQRREDDRDRQEAFRRRRREYEQALASLGVSDVEQANALLAATEAITSDLAALDGELRGLRVETLDLARLTAERDATANEAERARHALDGMGELGRDPQVSRDGARAAVAATLPARDRARSEEDQSLGRVEANQVDAEQVAATGEALVVARDRLAELERRLAVYQATLAGIEAAELATMKTAAQYLEERMGPAMSRITDGRYADIEVDEKDLAFRVRSSERDGYVPADDLSRGTADQLYLAARLGLVRLVTLDRRPPLILDDPFVTFDDGRADRAVRLLKDVASEDDFQVLYLTCSDRYDAHADRLIVLGGPGSPGAEAEPAVVPGEPGEPAPDEAATGEPTPDESATGEPAPSESAPDEPDEPGEPGEPAPGDTEAKDPEADAAVPVSHEEGGAA